MTYAPDMPAAARRHLQAAHILFNTGTRPDVSGYLYGIAAECAVKAMMLDAGMRPVGSTGSRRDDPFYAHFPELRTMLRDAQLPRTPLRRFIEDDRFMSHWDTDIRYCKGTDIQVRWIAAWRRHAREVVDCIGT
jgi:hypothetical protein